MVKSGPVTVNQFVWDIGVEAGLPLLLQDHDASYVYGPGGMLLEELIAGGGLASGTPYYYHTDQLGSVRVTTNDSGAVANTYTYDAYGNTLSSTGSTVNPFGYTGEYTDAESGFVYLRARYYDPESQQFLTVDPALAWTEQAYAYVGGSPTNYTDAAGLWVDPPGPCGHSYYGRCTGGGSSTGSWGVSVPGPVPTREPPVPTHSGDSDGGLWGGICAFFTHNSDPNETERKLLEAASMGPAITVTKGDNLKNFRQHWKDHKQLIRREDGQRWNKWTNGNGDDFISDLQTKIESGYFKYEGLGGWQGPGAPDTYALIYKSANETLVLRQNGEFWTLLRNGRDLALEVEIYIKPGEDE